MPRSALRVVLAVALSISMAGLAEAGVGPQNLAAIDLREYWRARLPLEPGDGVNRVSLLDDNLYIITDANRVFAVHAGTGIIRWSAAVARPDQTVRGPTHSQRFAVFTTPTGVKLFSRRSGVMASEARDLRGVLIEVRGDIADLNLGELHGITLGSELRVMFRGEVGPDRKPKARFKATTVKARETTGKLLDFEAANLPRAGDPVEARLAQTIQEVAAPFSPSSPAVADDDFVYFGAANQRFYSLSIIGGYRHWQVLTPRTVSATPILRDQMLIIAGQNGAVTAYDTARQTQSWQFTVEGAIFANPLLAGDALYVASADRSLYAVHRSTGERRWRTRFDSELLTRPAASGDTVFQFVSRAGLIALAAEDGGERWREGDGLGYLSRDGDHLFILGGHAPEADAPPIITRVSRLHADTGKRAAEMPISGIDFVLGSEDPTALYFCDRGGELTCARPRNAPHLKPAELAEVLRDDDARSAMAALEARDAARKAAAAAKPPATPDWFSSGSKAPPAAGSSLVPPEESPASEPAEPEAPAAADEDTATTDEDAPSEGEPTEDADAATDENDNTDDASENDNEGDASADENDNDEAADNENADEDSANENEDSDNGNEASADDNANDNSDENANDNG